jgi:hypothetical protein
MFAGIRRLLARIRLRMNIVRRAEYAAGMSDYGAEILEQLRIESSAVIERYRH